MAGGASHSPQGEGADDRCVLKAAGDCAAARRIKLIQKRQAAAEHRTARAAAAATIATVTSIARDGLVADERA